MPWTGLVHGLPGVTPAQMAAGAAALQTLGPRIRVEITLPSAAVAVRSENDPVPQPVTGVGLIDTGASNTSIDEQVATKLGLQIVNRASVMTPSTTEERNVVAARMTFPGSQLPPIEQPMLCTTLLGQGIIALIGRDFLRGKTLHYDGVLSVVTLTW